MRPLRLVAAMVAIAPLVASGLVAVPKASDASDAAATTAPLARSAAWTGWVSSPTDGSRRLASVSSTTASPTATVVVDPTVRGRTWRGVGAAVTDASVGLLADRSAATQLLFSATAGAGARLSWVRLPMSATDLSPQLWAWDPASPPAQALAAAAYIRDQVVPLRQTLAVVGSPWTAPASMKEPATLRGGWLRPDAETSYGDRLVAHVAWLRAQGVPMRALTLGNEPFYVPDYPSMGMPVAQQARLAKAIAPRLRDQGVELWAVDHNWEHRTAVDAVLAQAPGAFAAAAFHCYGGSPGQMAALSVPAVVTECTGTDDGWAGTFAWDARNLVVDAVRAGSTGLFFWNLALDTDHGPVDGASSQGCKTCRGLVTVDTSSGSVHPEPEFYTAAQLARAADPGARTVAVETTSGLPVVAFANPDGTLGVFGHNPTTATQVVSVRTFGGGEVRFLVRAGELFTFRGPALTPVTKFRGRLVVTKVGTRYLVDRAGYRHAVSSSTVFRCLGGSAAALTGVPGAVMSHYPSAERAACRQASPGDIYRATGGAAYLLTSAGAGLARSWLPTGAAYTCAVAQGHRVVNGPRYQVWDMKVAADRPSLCLLRAPSGAVYAINSQGKREWIPDAPTLGCRTMQGVPLVDVPESSIQAIPEAGWHWCLDKDLIRGRILRHHDGDASFVHTDGTRTWIPDGPTWQCRINQGLAVVNTEWRGYVDAFPDAGWDYCFDVETMKGRIISHPDGDSHLVDAAGVRHWIPDLATFQCLRDKGIEQVSVRWREYITEIPEGAWATCP